MENGKLLEVILDEVRANRRGIADLDAKLDSKIDTLHGRITAENVARSSFESGINERIKGLCARINWLYVITGGIALAIIGSALAIIMEV